MSPDGLDLAELRRLAQSVARGPWVYGGQGWVFAAENVGGDDPEFSDLVATTVREQEGEFIAAANPRTVLRLLDELDANLAKGSNGLGGWLETRKETSNG